MDNTIKKNILDLQFQKNIIVASSAVVIAFTYIVALVISLITNQINLEENDLLIFVFSALFLGPCIYFFMRSRTQMNMILAMLKNIQKKEIE